jgi:drug/metabolite transporter (DMT)-like permease
MHFRSITVYLLAVLSMLFWGLSYVWFKIAVQWYEPLTIIFVRLILSGAFMILFMLLTRTWQKVKRAHLKYFLLISFTQPFCYFLGESFGLKFVSSTMASVIIATIPLFSPIAAHFLVREKASPMIIFGIAFSFVGILLMLFNPDLSLNAAPIGVFLLFVAVSSAVAYSVIIRKIPNEYNPVTIITFQNLMGAAYFLPLFLIFDFQHFITVKPNSELISAILLLSFFGSTLAYVFYIIVIKAIGVIKANIFTNLIPVFTGVTSYFVLKEEFTAPKVIGMILVMLGVIISQSQRIGQVLLKNNRKKLNTGSLD